MTQRRNLVLGLGKTGLSVARWLTAHGESVVVNDSRAKPPAADAVRALGSTVVTQFGGFDLNLLADADRIVVSPGVSSKEPIVCEALRQGLPVVGDIELFAGVVAAPVVAITGTNGKSTVTTLVAEMIGAAGRRVLAGGNLGEPVLDLLSLPVPDVYVLELSSYQLESTYSLELQAAAILNVTADHMDRYENITEYAAAKASIFRRARVAIVNADDPVVRTMRPRDAINVSFSLNTPDADYTVSNQWLMRRNERLMLTNEIALPGRHNVANALAALAIGDALGLSMTAMLGVLRTFSGLPHRMQIVAEQAGVRYIDDSKGTNVGATVAAVAGLVEPLVLVAGGDGKGQDFTPLAIAFAGRVRHAVLIGRDREALARAIGGVCSYEFSEDMGAAVAAAARAAQRGDSVLLSPACASTDMYRDYVSRGDAFADAARRLSA